MCGIAGIYNLSNEPISGGRLKHMIASLRHRGPDGEGFVLFQAKGKGQRAKNLEFKCADELSATGQELLDYNIGFGHCRLAIIDLTEAGHQPMCNENRTIWITYNGEIYNYTELSRFLKLKGHIFKSKTDTEVIIHAYEEWGVDCLKRFNGMWAFAIWDNRKKRLFCARDRMGIKPFYYYFDKGRFLFASEIKALLVNEFIERSPNDKIIWDYLVDGYVDHTDNTFFTGIKQLLPAHYLFIENDDLITHRYWDLKPDSILTNITYTEASERFYELFEDSIRLHLRSDVPLGTCLSGGLDSSSIVCMVNKLLFGNGQAYSESIVGQQKTFSSCFEDKRFDERNFIHEVVKQTNVDAKYIFPDGADLLCYVDTMVWNQDEPFPSVRLFSQWHVMKQAREHGVTVLLDGQGGDELLAGYHFFFQPYFEYLLQTIQLKKLVGEINSYSRIHECSKPAIIRDLLKFVTPNTVLKLKKCILNKISNKDENAYPWLNKDFFKEHEHKTRISPRFSNDPFKSCTYAYLSKYRLPSLLRFEDRNSMAFSLEARVPFLDYRLIEFIFSLPNDQLIRNGTTKFVLRKAMEGLLPAAIVNRTDKMGFTVPEDYWLQKLNKAQILDIFSSTSFLQREYFNHNQLLKDYELYCSGQKNVDSSLVWKWINLELWLRKFVDNRGFCENIVN